MPKPQASKLYMQTESGEVFMLGDVTEINLEPYDPTCDCERYITTSIRPPITGTFEVSFDFVSDIMCQPKVKLKIFGITNNCIRMHGGRPMRKISQRHLRKKCKSAR